MMSLTRDAVHRNLPALLKLCELAMIISAHCVTSVDGKHDASTAKYGYAMMQTIGLQVPRQGVTRTGYAEESNAYSKISR